MLRRTPPRGPGREDPPAVVVEPALRQAVGRSPPLDELPEIVPVMVLDEVAHLVHGPVVEHVVGREHEPPVVTERARAGARAPAGPLVPQRDARVLDAER